jgi:hypothetical protein
MELKVKFDERIIDLIMKEVEKRNDLSYYDFYHYQVKELWVNKSCK